MSTFKERSITSLQLLGINEEVIAELINFIKTKKNKLYINSLWDNKVDSYPKHIVSNFDSDLILHGVTWATLVDNTKVLNLLKVNLKAVRIIGTFEDRARTLLESFNMNQDSVNETIDMIKKEGNKLSVNSLWDNKVDGYPKIVVSKFDCSIGFYATKWAAKVSNKDILDLVTY